MKKTLFASICLSLVSAICITGKTMALPGAIYAWDLQPASPAGNDFVKVSVGLHFIGLRSDGTIVEWDADGEVYEQSLPEGTQLIDVAAGIGFWVGIDTNGALVNSGPDNYLGPNPPGVYTAVAACDIFAIALREDGVVVTWPNNEIQNVYNGLPFYCADISLGVNHISFLRPDGSVGTYYQNNHDISQEYWLPPGNDFVAVAAGGDHSLALKADGSLVAWGNNDNGQTDVPADNNFIDIAAGNYHSSALRDDGTIVTWGYTSVDTTSDDCATLATAIFSGVNDYDSATATMAIVELGSVIPATITAPNGGETWSAGSIQNITWDNELTTGYVDIWLLKNGSRDKFLGQAPVSDGSFAWNIPTPFTPDSDYTIGLNWINSCGLSYSETSDAPFTITSSATMPTITVTSPNGGETWDEDTPHQITWDSTNPTGNVEIWYLGSIDDFDATYTSYTFLGTVPMAQGYFDWNIRNCSTYSKILIRWTNGATSVQDTSDNVFEITNCIAPDNLPLTLTLTSPIGGEDWPAGSTQTISWTSDYQYGFVDIDYVDNDLPLLHLATVPISDGSYQWDICPGMSEIGGYISEGAISIRDAYRCTESTSGEFEITEPLFPDFMVTSPTAYEQWLIGSQVTISWTSTNLIGDLDIFLPDNINNHWGHVVVPITDGSYTWVVPPSLEPGIRKVTLISQACGQRYEHVAEVEIVEQPALLGDFDGDGDVDLRDLAQLQTCFTGPEIRLQTVPCNYFDFSADADVDINDFLEMHNDLTGP